MDLNKKILEILDNKDVKKVYKYTKYQFRKSLNRDDVYEAALNAAWKCAEKHDETKQRLHSSFARFIKWDCLRILKEKNKNNDKLLGNNVKYISTKPLDVSDKFVSMIEQVDETNKQILIQHYKYNMSFREIAESNGYSHETARNKLKIAIENFKRVYLISENENI